MGRAGGASRTARACHHAHDHGNTLRIAARLVQADNGFIIWSETYDKPVDDLLMVQDDIADAVAKALKATIARGAGAPPATP